MTVAALKFPGHINPLVNWISDLGSSFYNPHGAFFFNMARRDYAGFSQDWLRRRFSVRPGLTCSWQIQANRNDLPFQEWMQLDMAYIDSWSLTEDLKICLKTVLVVLSGDGR